MASPFRAIIVDRLTEGPTTIFWDLVDGFRDAGPYRFRVQVGSTGSPFSDDWKDVGPETANTYYMLDSEKHERNKTITTHYRVILSTADRVYISGPASALQHLDRYQFRVASEMLRRGRKALENNPYHRQGYILFRRRFGPACTRCIDPNTNEVTDMNCPVCYGSGKLGGYFAPLAYQFAMITPRVITERVKAGVGTSADDYRTGMFLGYPLLQTYDVFVDAHSDERFIVSTVKYVETIGAVPISQELEMGVPDFSNVVYKFPIPARIGPY
jgi:hypothetical protein